MIRSNFHPTDMKPSGQPSEDSININRQQYHHHSKNRKMINDIGRSRSFSRLHPEKFRAGVIGVAGLMAVGIAAQTAVVMYRGITQPSRISKQGGSNANLMTPPSNDDNNGAPPAPSNGKKRTCGCCFVRGKGNRLISSASASAIASANRSARNKEFFISEEDKEKDKEKDKDKDRDNAKDETSEVPPSQDINNEEMNNEDMNKDDPKFAKDLLWSCCGCTY